MLKLLKFLEKIRAYPDEKKKLIGYFVSGALTVIIVSMSFIIPSYLNREIPKPVPERQVASPFSAIQKELSKSFSNIKKSVSLPSKSELGLLLKNLSSSQMIVTSSSTSSPKDITAKTATTTQETLEIATTTKGTLE